VGSFDPLNNFEVRRCTDPGDWIDTEPSTTNVSVDTRGFGWATFILTKGVLADGVSWTATCQSSSDDGQVDTYADIEAAPTAATKATITTAQSGKTASFSIRCNPTERYLKLVWTKSGTFTQSEMQAVCVLTHPLDSAVVGTTIGGQFNG